MKGISINRQLRKMLSAFGSLTRFERMLWISSMAMVALSYLLSPQGDVLSLSASLVGVTSLIFIAKGYVIGQVLVVVFAILYGIASYEQRYYGEVITYLGMTGPIAVAAIVSWLRHQFEGSAEVQVAHMTPRKWLQVVVFTLLVTVAFYFILRALGTASLWVSTLSVATSFSASYLTYLRSPYYGIGYGANDVVLIVLWAIASAKDIAYLPMVACFVMFLANDIYGFINWRRMRRRQQGN